MKHIHYLLLSVLLAFSSCQNNEETVIENNFKGHYKITAMESDQPLDLNNDGISSSNLYEEIAAPVHGNNKDETPIPFYHFEEWSNYAEVRPAFDDQPDYQLLLLRLPYLAFYTHDLTDYEYTLTEDSRVDLRLVNPGAVRLGVVERLERTGKDTFVVEMTARYFDFFNHQWTYTRINVTYEKVERSSE